MSNFVVLYKYLVTLGGGGEEKNYSSLVSRLGVELELQLPAYTTATAMLRVLNPLSKARNQNRIPMGISQVCFCWATWEHIPLPPPTHKFLENGWNK